MKKPPINLNLLKIRFPITAWVSILHRLSGILIFMLIPGLLWMLQESLASLDRFLALKKTLNQPLWMISLWVLFAGVIYHSLAGIRHLLMDLQVGNSKQKARFSAWVVLVLTIILIIGII